MHKFVQSKIAMIHIIDPLGGIIILLKSDFLSCLCSLLVPYTWSIA